MPRQIRFSCRAGGVLLLLCASHAGATQLLIPAYFEDQSLWTQMTTAAAEGAHITAILNPNSGPGTSVDSTYLAEVKALEAAGGTVVGYVPTNYGTGNLTTLLSTTKSEINSYESFYPVEGIFLDEMSQSTNSLILSYYAKVYSYIKTPDASMEVIGNPGTNVPQNYQAVADTLVTYEDTSTAYASNVPKSWQMTGSANQFANIVTQETTATAMLADIAQARSQNVGYVYVTDDGADGNPYNTLPTYFQTEVAAVLPETGHWLGDGSAVRFCGNLLDAPGSTILIRRALRR